MTRLTRDPSRATPSFTAGAKRDRSEGPSGPGGRSAPSHSSTHRDASDLRPLEGSRAGRLAPDLFSGLSPLGRQPSGNPWQGRIGHLRPTAGAPTRFLGKPYGRIADSRDHDVVSPGISRNWSNIQWAFYLGPLQAGLRRPPRAIAIPCARLPEAWPWLRDHGWSRGRCPAASDSSVWATSGRAAGRAGCEDPRPVSPTRP